MMSREERSDLLLKEMEEKEKKEKRNKAIIRLLIVCFTTIGIIFLVFLYMRFIATSNLLVREYKVVSNKLPDSLNGLRVVHFTDLHYNSTIDKNSFNNIIDKINNLKPDIVVFTGDLVSEEDLLTDQDLSDLIEGLNRIECTINKYVVRGNHDYHHDYFNKVFDKTDFIFLDNNYDLIYYNGMTPILISGIGSGIKGDVNIDSAFSVENQNDLFTLAILHEPDILDDIKKKYSVDLCLSGHSHNGQIRLPYFGAITTINGAKKYYDSYYKVENTDLYVSGGLGTSVYKLRLFNRPSINFYRLTKKG